MAMKAKKVKQIQFGCNPNGKQRGRGLVYSTRKENKKNHLKIIRQMDLLIGLPVIGKRFYFECANGVRVSLRAINGLLAAKQLPKWVKI